jgi:hypothetical protein
MEHHRIAYLVLGHGYDLLEQVEVPQNEVVIYSAKAGDTTNEVDIENVISMFRDNIFPDSIMQSQITVDTDISDVKEFLVTDETNTTLYTRKPSQHIHDQIVTFETTFSDGDHVTFKKAGMYSNDDNVFPPASDDIEDALTVFELPILTTLDEVLIPYTELMKIYSVCIYPNFKRDIFPLCAKARLGRRNNLNQPCITYRQYMTVIKTFDLSVSQILDRYPNSTIALMVCRHTDDDEKIRNSFVIEGFGYKKRNKSKKQKRRNKSKKQKRRNKSRMKNNKKPKDIYK